ncbi:MAG: ABC transporter ATP-binding protein [Vulcanococcus sp.]
MVPRGPVPESGAVERQPYLELEAVESWLGPRPVFKNLSLCLNLGEHTVVLGANGAGKSALIKLLSRELYPVVKPGSALRIFGESRVNLWDLRQRMGLVSADLQANHRPDTPGLEVVLSGLFGSMGLGRPQQPTPEQREQAAELLDACGLTSLAHRPFGQCSDGQRRRLLLARAMVHGPDLLVLDEPTNGLDIKSRHQLLETLRSLAQRGTTLLLVTHQVEAIIPEISRVVFLKDGMISAQGSCAELLKSQPLSSFFETPLEVVERGGWRQVVPATLA